VIDHALDVSGLRSFVLIALAVPPRDSISATSESSSSCRRAATTIRAPFSAKSSAVARPMPLLAPVISATLSFISDIVGLLLPF